MNFKHGCGDMDDMMSDDDYVADSGLHCPFCRSDDIKVHGMHINGDRAVRNATCNFCHSTWAFLYQLKED